MGRNENYSQACEADVSTDGNNYFHMHYYDDVKLGQRRSSKLKTDAVRSKKHYDNDPEKSQETAAVRFKLKDVEKSSEAAAVRF